jgi:leader peptidase (prepilin peptidase)/N-methyltransferase
MAHWLYIPFLFALGACVGSFLNVVVYRLPRGQSLITPPSRCPECQTPLAWYDNVPVFGWIFLRGKCRYCGKPISPRYPIVEAITGLLFVFYYVMFFILHAGPCRDLGSTPFTGWFVGDLTDLSNQWPIYALDMMLISGLLAASLIDIELFIIPAGIPWWMGFIAIAAHAAIDHPGSPGVLIEPPSALALSAGAALGLGISIILLQLRILPISFPEGNLLEAERDEMEQQAKAAADKGEKEPQIPPEFTPAQVRHEMRKEMLFLMPPLALGGLSLALHLHAPAYRHLWYEATKIDWLNGLLGALLGGLVGGFVVWLTRILGSYTMGKEAMGLGDVHLMFGIGAVMGAGLATITFFLAPFAGILAGLYLLIARSRRQLPYGPYLSLAAGLVMLFGCPIADYLGQGLQAMGWIIRQALGGS